MFPQGTYTNLIGGYTNAPAASATAAQVTPSYRMVPVA